MATDFRAIDAGFLAELREHFTNAEIAELGFMIGQYHSFGRMLVIAGSDKGACEIYVPNY